MIKVVITLHHSLSSADIDFHIRNAIYFALHILGSVAKTLQNLCSTISVGDTYMYFTPTDIPHKISSVLVGKLE